MAPKTPQGNSPPHIPPGSSNFPLPKTPSPKSKSPRTPSSGQTSLNKTCLGKNPAPKTPPSGQSPSKKARLEKSPAGPAKSPASSATLGVPGKAASSSPGLSSIFGSSVSAISPSPVPSPLAQSAVFPKKLPYSDLPSGGAPFVQVLRQEPKFLKEIRADFEQPMRPDITPRGFSNPAMLCYRNSVVTSLLNTERFLAFLHSHMHTTRHLQHLELIRNHLLTRLYHLAVAYWEKDGRHPLPPRETYERLLALFWRSCRRVPDKSDESVGEDEVTPDFPKDVHCWLDMCNNEKNQDATKPLCERQQDASGMMNWLTSVFENQIFWRLDQYGHDACFYRVLHVFNIRMAIRHACPRCQNPIRLRDSVNIQSVLQVEAQGPDPRPGARVQRLADYLECSLNGTLSDKSTCKRCHQEVDHMPCLKRLQTTPEVLNLQLMRVTECNTDTPGMKKSTVIDIPQFLDMSRWLEPHVYGTHSRVIYRLSAVISHRGLAQQDAPGHCVSFVRSTNRKEKFQNMSDPAAAWRAVNEESELQASIDGFIRAHGQTHPAPGQTGKGKTPDLYDDQWLLPDVSVVRQQEARDNGWTCISDTEVFENVPYRKITNTTRDINHTLDNPAWFDPTMLVYEKWIEEFHTNAVLNDRVYQQPMNKGLGGDTDTPVPEKQPVLVVGEPEGLFWDKVETKDVDTEEDLEDASLLSAWYGGHHNDDNEGGDVTGGNANNMEFILNSLYGGDRMNG